MSTVSVLFENLSNEIDRLVAETAESDNDRLRYATQDLKSGLRQAYVLAMKIQEYEEVLEKEEKGL